MLTHPEAVIPSGWHEVSHRLWLAGDKEGALQGIVAQLNASGPNKPIRLVHQMAYYLYLIQDYASCATLLTLQNSLEPGGAETLLNLAVCCSRLGRYEQAVANIRELLTLQPDNVVAHDTLTSSSHQLGQLAEASASGSRALELKDAATRPHPGAWRIPPGRPGATATAPGKRNVVSFSLWGSAPRYLRGALRNLLLAPEFLPGWEVRFYLDDSVPGEFVALLGDLGARTMVGSRTAPLREKLCWRFQVANDPGVGYFLVRDTDSVIGIREVRAVDAWLASDAWFHVMRDWWTHTDLLMAGMWGGIAGVLPPLMALLAAYAPLHVETPNVDQWFLRDRVWGYVRSSCLVHDRCFRMPGSEPFPGPTPEGNSHVGQNEYVSRPTEQERFLLPWLERYPCLVADVRLG